MIALIVGIVVGSKCGFWWGVLAWWVIAAILEQEEAEF